jgi:hypothetical protein
MAKKPRVRALGTDALWPVGSTIVHHRTDGLILKYPAFQLDASARPDVVDCFAWWRSSGV